MQLTVNFVKLFILLEQNSTNMRVCERLILLNFTIELLNQIELYLYNPSCIRFRETFKNALKCQYLYQALKIYTPLLTKNPESQFYIQPSKLNLRI